MIINGVKVERNSSELIKIDVGRLPSGTLIKMDAHVFRANHDGPVALITAGVHGDEINGIETIRRALRNGLFNNLKMGAVIAIPLVNVFGFINFSREVPDGKDVNRSFPGIASGSLASRVAHKISKEILPFIDFGIDLHTGGNCLYNFPQVRFSKGDKHSRELAESFNPPFLIASNPIAKSFRKSALVQGKPILVYEGGESTRLDGLAIEHALLGIKNVLGHQGMIDYVPTATRFRHFGHSRWQRAPKAGIFIWSKSSGMEVAKGEPIGVIGSPNGNREQVIRAKYDGYIIGHNNAPVVNQGDALFHIANV